MRTIWLWDAACSIRGSGSQGRNAEKEIRKVFVDKDWVEGVLLLPENLFYNTTAPDWKDVDGFAKVLELDQIEDYNLSPSRYVSNGKTEVHKDVSELLVELSELEEERQAVDEKLNKIMKKAVGRGFG